MNPTLHLPQPRARRLAALYLGVWGLGCLLSGCAQPPPPLSNTHRSAEALAEAVLDAFERGDRAAAGALAVNEQEFRDHVWPDLPVARPEQNMPFWYVWGDLHQKSEASLTRTMAEVRGEHLALLDVTFAGEATKYAGYTVHRDTVLKVRNAKSEVLDIRLFGSSLERDGAWKVFSYVVDD